MDGWTEGSINKVDLLSFSLEHARQLVVAEQHEKSEKYM